MATKLTPLPTPPVRLASPKSVRPDLGVVPFEPFTLIDSPGTQLPAWPSEIFREKPAPPPSSLAAFPTPPTLRPRDLAPLTSLPFSPPQTVVESKKEDLREIAIPQPQPTPADFTDEDLREALQPILGVILSKDGSSSDPSLEPMLRATIRRALAEYSPASRPFKPPGMLDRLVWRMQALFSSRTYEDILFEKTNRFQVEEVFLLDASTLALVSFASCDPARHSSARRVEGTAQRLALQLLDENDAIRESFSLTDGRTVVSCGGSHAVLMAIVRGGPGDMLRSDLEYALHRIESRFRERFHNDGSPLMNAVQPYLEDCLLIQSPATAA